MNQNQIHICSFNMTTLTINLKSTTTKSKPPAKVWYFVYGISVRYKLFHS